MTEVIRPSHAYVPGVTQRHPENAFDHLKAGIGKGMSETAMRDSLAWRAAQDYRAQGYFWECHEVLETLWMAAEDGPVRSYLQAVIQLANAQLKVKMGRPKAAMRLCDIVCAHLASCAGRENILGQSVDALRAEARRLASRQGDTQ